MEREPRLSIALIACGKSKLTRPAPARSLYTGQLFRKSLAYAEARDVDVAFVLSAKHGLVSFNHVLEPYDMTLNGLSREARHAWALRVLASLEAKADLDRDKFIVLAGRAYREHLVARLRYAEVPLEGLRFGEQLRYLTAYVGKRGG